MVVIPADRLAALSKITLYRGAHDEPSSDATASDMELCVNEFVAFLAGEPHSDRPMCQCAVIGSAIMRFNDRVDDETRQALVAYDGDNPLKSLAARSMGTRGDGHATQRGYMAADFAVRIALPIWLDASGRTDAAQRLREIPELVDAATSRSARTIVLEVRKGLPDYWAWRSEVREKVRAAVLQALKDKPAATDAATAAAAADATAAATDAATATTAATDAAAAAAAADAADAATAAAADAATATTAATDAAATDAAAAAAAAAAAGDDGPTWQQYYDAVYAAVRAKLNERWPDAIAQANAAFLDLLERMVALGEDERTIELAA